MVRTRNDKAMNPSPGLSLPAPAKKISKKKETEKKETAASASGESIAVESPAAVEDQAEKSPLKRVRFSELAREKEEPKRLTRTKMKSRPTTKKPPPQRKMKSVNPSGEAATPVTENFPPTVEAGTAPTETGEKEGESLGEKRRGDDSEEEVAGGRDGGGGDISTQVESEAEASQTETENNRRNSGPWEEVGAMRPEMHFTPDKYSTQIKLATRCFVGDFIEMFEKLDLSEREKDWFLEHEQFMHILHMPRSNHMVQPMWMLLQRTAKIERKKEAWFLVNGVPIRYGLREHCLLSGLDCRNYSLNWKREGDPSFKEKYFGDKKGKVFRKHVKEMLEGMKDDGSDDRLKMLVLYFLSSIIYSPAKTGDDAKPVLEIFLNYVGDLKLCKTFAWGRLSFDYMLESINDTMEHFKTKELAPWTLPGFCLPLELLAVEAIPQLRNGLREPVDFPFEYCPRMCRSKWKKCDFRGFPLPRVYEKLGDSSKDIESMLIVKEYEKETLAEILEKDDDVDNHDPIVASWETRLNHGLTVEFEDMKEEDLQGRKKKDEGDVAEGDPKPKKRKRGTRLSLQNVMSAVETLTEQVETLTEQVKSKLEGLDDRLKAVEEQVKAQNEDDGLV